MFYYILKWYVRVGLYWYFPVIRKPAFDVEDIKMPTVVVSTNPNGLLDALVIAAYSPYRYFFLVSGRLFKKTIFDVLFRKLYMLPIYGRRDCADFSVRNDFTYDESIRQLKSKKHILLFPEFKSTQHSEVTLAPFYNGSIISLLERAYKEGVPLQLRPCVLTYGAFAGGRRGVEIDFKTLVDTTEYIERQEIQSAKVIFEVREKMMQESVVPVGTVDNPPVILYHVMNFLAQIGYLLHRHIYKFLYNYIKHRVGKSKDFEGVFFLTLLIFYPPFVLFISYIIGRVGGYDLGVFTFLLLPITAYFMQRFKKIN